MDEWQVRYNMLLEENKILQHLRNDYARLQRENARLRMEVFKSLSVKERILDAIAHGYRTTDEIIKYAVIAKSSLYFPLHQLLLEGKIRRRGPYNSRKDRSLTRHYYGRALKKEGKP